MKTIKLVYILSSGHSGSTILEILLSNHPDAISIGEAWVLPKRLTFNPNVVCSCGQPFSDCPFWKQATREFKGALTEADLAWFITNSDEFEHPTSPTLFITKNNTSKPRDALEKFITVKRSLYQAIHKVGGGGFIIDSSKTPALALALTHMPSIDLRIIHLTKDPRAAVFSSQKRRKELDKDHASLPSILRDTAGWILQQWNAERVLKRLPKDKTAHIQYESIMAGPHRAMAKLGQAIDEDLTAAADAIENNQPLKTGHIIGGNPIRRKKGIVFNPDQDWLSKLPPPTANRIWLLSGWLASKYGYHK